MSEPDRVSEWTKTEPLRQQVTLVLDLVREYYMLYGGFPTIGWVLKTLGER